MVLITFTIFFHHYHYFPSFFNCSKQNPVRYNPSLPLHPDSALDDLKFTSISVNLPILDTANNSNHVSFFGPFVSDIAFSIWFSKYICVVAWIRDLFLFMPK